MKEIERKDMIIRQCVYMLGMCKKWIEMRFALTPGRAKLLRELELTEQFIVDNINGGNDGQDS